MRLEDRYADRLIGTPRDLGFGIILATYARAWIDLNRREDEIDVAMLTENDRVRVAKQLLWSSDKVRGGLGLFPRRVAGGDLWQGKFSWEDFAGRISSVYEAYHHALEKELNQIQHTHGYALLIDVHSMPPLGGHHPARIVLGDRRGGSAPPWLIDRMQAEAVLDGLAVAHNAPYAGGFIVERHSRPHVRRFAVQIEVDRTLYLDDAGEPISGACRSIGALIGRMALGAEMAMADRFGGRDWLHAAE